MSEIDTPNGNTKYSRVPTLALVGAIAAMGTYFAHTTLRTAVVLEKIEIRMGVSERQHEAMAGCLARIERQTEDERR